MSKNSAVTIDRRGFVAGSAAGLAVAAVMPTVAHADEPAWDEEYDFVVCGSGTAMWGAIAAAGAGASVCILEKSGVLGGTASLSTGAFFLPNNPVAEEMGLEDSEQDAIDYITRIAEGQGDPEVIAAYPGHCRDFVNWSRETLQIPWQPWGTGSMEMWGGFVTYYDVEGAHLGRTMGYEYVESPDADLSSGGGYLGPVMWNVLKDKLDELGVVAYTSCPADRLVTDEAGAVVGVVALRDGAELRVKANKGVLLGCGDFSHNKKMRETFLRTPLYNTALVHTNTGDGIRMGMEVGADLANMSCCYGCSTFGFVGDGLPEEIQIDFGKWDCDVLRNRPNSLIVNAKGFRFGDESSNYHMLNRAFEAWDSDTFSHGNIPGFWICDSQYMQYYPLPHAAEIGEVPEGVVVADTLEELAQVCGIDAEQLVKTVDEFNGYARDGHDPVWHRGEHAFDTGSWTDPSGRTDLVNPCLGTVEQGPFYCLLYLPGTLGTSGGLRINAQAQVVSTRGEVIPGLYASGCNAASIYGAGYPGSGGPVGGGSVMSYVAALDAVAR